MLRDLRYAVRVLLKAKGWSAVVLLSLALGIGANTALFSAVNGLLFTTIPVTDPHALVRLRWAGPNDMLRDVLAYGFTAETAGGERASASFSYPMFERLRDGNDTLEGLVAAAPTRPLNLVIDGRAEIGSGFAATGNYFQMLGVTTGVGRVITPDDDRPEAEPVALISHRFWERRFGLDQAVIGTVIRVNDTPTTIVGVLPASYTGVRRPMGEAPDLHLPLATFREPVFGDRRADATWWWLQLIGRMRPGVTPAQVQGNLDGLFRAAARQGMNGYLTGLSPDQRALPEHQDLTRVPGLLADSARRGVYDPSPRASRQAGILGVVVVLVLLIVCANVAALLLSRAVMRRHEIAVRLSVGASRGRLVRQLVTEGVLLSTLGGALGVPVAYGTRQLLPFGQATPFDWRVFGFVALLSLATGLVCSLVPALRATGVQPAGALREQHRALAPSRTLVSRALVIAQVAVSLALLVGSGLFLKTLANLRDVDLGFNPVNVLLFQIDPTPSGYDRAQSEALFDRIAAGLRGVTGVRSVARSGRTLLAGRNFFGTVYAEGRDGDGLDTQMMRVSPEFFDTMGIPVLAGRAVEPQDRQDAPGVVVINARAARELFGVDDPLGRRLGFSPDARTDLEIVGVVRDARYNGVRGTAPPTAYQPATQRPPGTATFAVRTAGPPGTLTSAVRDTVQLIDPRLAIMNVSTQAAEIEARFSDERLSALAYTVFGGLATLLAAIGLFGLASYTVTQRTTEIGIRMALGAQSSGIARMVLAESLVLVGLGIVAGVGIVLVAGRLLASLLYDLTPTDPLTILQAVVVLVSVAAVAGYLPARRAARVDPMVALQDE